MWRCNRAACWSTRSAAQREALSAASVWEQVGIGGSDTLNYEQQHGDALYRRSMYTYWKRMAMMPDMDAFDAPMRDVVCTRRQRTDTPLQALVTMNDVQWVEAARALGAARHQRGRQAARAAHRPDERDSAGARSAAADGCRAEHSLRRWKSTTRPILKRAAPGRRGREEERRIDSRAGAGRVDHGGQRDAEPGRDGEQSSWEKQLMEVE
jgi:hypothetical protein